MPDDFQYDIAFSFLARDEPVAVELNDLLEGRLRTFLYTKKQEALAGTNGEESFSEIFGGAARLVVVLYRSGWGETSWTRIEETAIRNRAYDHGYYFVKFIPLEDSPNVPNWLPRTQLWIGLRRWGPAGAASVIEARVQELGGEPTEESLSGKAARAARSIQFAEKRKAFISSEKGVQASNAEFDRLKGEVESAIAAIAEKTSVFDFSFKEAHKKFVILGRGPALHVYWDYRFANSLENSKLEATLWQGHPPWPGVWNFEDPKRLGTLKFHFDLTPSEECRWISADRERRQFTSAGLADFLLGYCLEQVEKMGKH